MTTSQLKRQKMRLSEYLPITIAMLLGGTACLGVAIASVSTIETQSRRQVGAALVEGGFDWADVSVDGLQVILAGTAPNEAARFTAVSTASGIVEASRVIDRMDVATTEFAAPPAFSVEILRNDDGISLIGLVPVSTDRDEIAEIAGRKTGITVTDLLEPADYPIPATWEAALDFGLDALVELPRSKITVEADRVSVTAITDSGEEKRRVEAALRRDVPEGVELVLDISAPRPVLTPYTLRFVIDEKGPHFDACSADSTEARQKIVEAARAAGLQGDANCQIGLGQPSPRWADAAVIAIAAVEELGGGSVTFSDADVTLQAPLGTRKADFDRIAGRLEVSLPAVFSLQAVLPEPKTDGSDTDGEDEAPEFVATRSPEGLVQLRGRLPDARTRAAVQSFAHARFGVDATEMAARIADDLPQGWPVRVLVSLEALSLLNNGAMIVRPDLIEITGDTGSPTANDDISRIISSKLGEDAEFRLDVTYVEALDPVAALPTPEECVEQINAAIAVKKITFAPGSAEIDADALETIDKVAEALKECQTVKMEIGGHTDSQGRESMNERLSQERADAVLNAIMARRVLTSNLTAKGYGEARPIADNGTEEGREANRRIEFRLILPEEEDAEAATADAGSDGDAGADGTQEETDTNEQN